MRFRKKPTEIEAVQYSDDMRVKDCLPEGVVIAYWDSLVGDVPIVHTANGPVRVHEGTWICKQLINGKPDYWPVKPDIFQATYEAVTE